MHRAARGWLVACGRDIAGNEPGKHGTKRGRFCVYGWIWPLYNSLRTGRNGTVMTIEARRKRLQAAIEFLTVLASDEDISVDNLPERVDYASLARLATARRYLVD